MVVLVDFGPPHGEHVCLPGAVRTESQMKTWAVVLVSASIAKKSRGSTSGRTKRSRDFSGNSGMP